MACTCVTDPWVGSKRLRLYRISNKGKSWLCGAQSHCLSAWTSTDSPNDCGVDTSKNRFAWENVVGRSCCFSWRHPFTVFAHSPGNLRIPVEICTVVEVTGCPSAQHDIHGKASPNVPPSHITRRTVLASNCQHSEGESKITL